MSEEVDRVANFHLLFGPHVSGPSLYVFLAFLAAVLGLSEDVIFLIHVLHCLVLKIESSL